MYIHIDLKYIIQSIVSQGFATHAISALPFFSSISNVNEETLSVPSLQFESRFESGNLRKAIQVSQLQLLLLYCVGY